MAKNPHYYDWHRHGSVKGRSQTHNPHSHKWVKRDTEAGRFIYQKSDQNPFKGARKEEVTFFGGDAQSLLSRCK